MLVEAHGATVSAQIINGQLKQVPIMLKPSDNEAQGWTLVSYENHRIVWVGRNYKYHLVQPPCDGQGICTAQVGYDVETNPINTNTKSSWNSNKRKPRSCTHQKNLALSRRAWGAIGDLSQQNPPQRTNC